MAACALTRHLWLAGESDGVDLGKEGWDAQITWFWLSRLTPGDFPFFSRGLIMTLPRSPVSHGQRLGKVFPRVHDQTVCDERMKHLKLGDVVV